MENTPCGEIRVDILPVGPLQSNCYLIYCSENRKALVVDPGDEGERILRAIQQLRLVPVMIINTHGHGDHIGANGFIKERFQIPIAIHAGDAPLLTDPAANLSAWMGLPIVSPPADQILRDGAAIPFEGNMVEVFHTPGHSPGGITLRIGHHLLTGDALFKGSIGRTDLPGSSQAQLLEGIRRHILSLPDDVIIYPGHGPSTTVGEERRYNPFLQGMA
ncbi:MAG TPA: MBL fold metallo-hydrolase [bacterium]|nr:MBL fold metallo-hydrolase [bacterium]HPP01572.1 MBL fold metallo-hydrolase [bacterium]